MIKCWMSVQSIYRCWMITGTLFVAVATEAIGQQPADKNAAEWRVLPFSQDGKLVPEWKHVWGGGFEVLPDGSVRTVCTDEGMGLLLYSAEQFGDCQIRIRYRCQNPSSNAGVYVRIDEGVLNRIDDPLQLRERDSRGRLTQESLARLERSSDDERESWYPVHHGYEVQICDSADEFHRTGVIYSLTKAPALPKVDGRTWRTMVITLRGSAIEVSVDGQKLTNFDSQSKDFPARKIWYEPKREHPRPERGFIGLQNHDPGDVVDFQDVSVRPLPRS